MIPCASCTFNWTVKFVSYQHINIARREGSPRQLIGCAEDKPVACDVLFYHKNRLAVRYAHAAPLPNSVVYQSLVCAKLFAACKHDVAALLLPRARGYKACVVAARDKADVLRIGFACVDKAVFVGYCAYVILIHLTDRKQAVFELLLRHRIKNIGLVFFSVSRALQKPSAVLFAAHLCNVMPCCDVVKSKHLRPFKKLAEFEISVAVDTRIWRAAAKIGIHELVHNTLLETVCKIKNVKGYAKLVCDLACVLHIIKRAAGLCALNADIIV